MSARTRPPTKGGAMGVETRKKLDIAVEEIEAAVVHYEAGKFVCAIALAGAGEEILGKIVTKTADRDNALQTRIKGTVAIYDAVTNGLPDVETDKAIEKRVANVSNWLRNELKHQDSGADSTISFDFKDGAEDMLDRAIDNYFRLLNDTTAIMRRYLSKRHPA